MAEFEKDTFSSIHKLQKRLGKNFEFSRQRGIAKRKQNSYRPLVVAPFEDRIVRRAILDVLLTEVSAVKILLQIPTSIGGIPGRGVPSAIDLVVKAIEGGARYYVRSDIESFFTKIPKPLVKEFIKTHVKDQEFANLFDRALDTELENINELGELRLLFPTGNDGVAQGSALSTLAGNIVLREFDEQLNGRNITCIRYVDDFILLGTHESSVRKAFESAQNLLQQLGMHAYSPWERSDKASFGEINSGFTFLGCDIKPALKLIQPSRKARQKFLNDIEFHCSETLRVLSNGITSGFPIQRRKHYYAHALVKLDGMISGWAHAFQFCNCKSTVVSLDSRVDELIQNFNRDARSLLQSLTARERRRFLGVQLLQDVPFGIVGNWPLH